MYRPVLVTPPTTTPVSLAEAKVQLDLPSADTEKDDLITMLIGAAVSHLDGWTGILGRCLITQTWRQDFDAFESRLRLPLYPVSAITSVKYLDTAGAEQTIASANYSLKTDDLGAYVAFVSGFSFPALYTEAPAVNVIYAAGYANAAAVPQDIRWAMLLLIRHWFDNPFAVIVGVSAQAMPQGVDALLSKWRRIRF